MLAVRWGSRLFCTARPSLQSLSSRFAGLKIPETYDADAVLNHIEGYQANFDLNDDEFSFLMKTNNTLYQPDCPKFENTMKFWTQEKNLDEEQFKALIMRNPRVLGLERENLNAIFEWF